MLLNNECSSNEIKEEIKKYLETNENEHTTTQTHGYREGSPEREVHSNTGLSKEDRKISNKQPNPTSTRTRGTTTKPRASRRKERTKKKAELNGIETKSTIVRINESRRWFFEKINKIDKPLSRLIKKKREDPNKSNEQ